MTMSGGARARARQAERWRQEHEVPPHIRYSPPWSGLPRHVRRFYVRRPASTKLSPKKPAFKKPAFRWPAPEKPAPKHPTCFLGKRVRKAFPDPDKKRGMKFFEGTVCKWLPAEQWFTVEYDDGDIEDYTMDELEKILPKKSVRGSTLGV